MKRSKKADKKNEKQTEKQEVEQQEAVGFGPGPELTIAFSDEFNAAAEKELKRMQAASIVLIRMLGGEVGTLKFATKATVLMQKKRGRKTEKVGEKQEASAGGPESGNGDGLTSRQIQGRYLGLIRQLKKGKRKEVSQFAKEHGRERAIELMQKRLGR